MKIGERYYLKKRELPLYKSKRINEPMEIIFIDGDFIKCRWTYIPDEGIIEFTKNEIKRIFSNKKTIK